MVAYDTEFSLFYLNFCNNFFTLTLCTSSLAFFEPPREPPSYHIYSSSLISSTSTHMASIIPIYWQLLNLTCIVDFLSWTSNLYLSITRTPYLGFSHTLQTQMPKSEPIVFLLKPVWFCVFSSWTSAILYPVPQRR